MKVLQILLEELQKEINKIMASVTNKDENFWERTQRNDTYLSAEKCIEYGIVDEIK